MHGITQEFIRLQMQQDHEYQIQYEKIYFDNGSLRISYLSCL